MADKIKGIIIEFGGETTKLQKALDTISNKGKKIQKELNDINKLLKFNPKNQELLKQKQELLNKSLQNTKEKLEALKKGEQELRKNPEHEKDWRNVKRQIIDTEQYLKNYEKQLKQVEKEMSVFTRAGEKVQKFGKSIEGAGKKLLPVTAGITAVATASVKSFSDVDKMLDIVVTKTGATGEELKELKQISKDVFSSEVAPSAEEAGNAVGELNTRFGFTGDILKNASIDFLKYAKITGQDVNTAIISVSRAMSDAGIESKNYKVILDQLSVAGQKTGIEVGKLTEMLTKYGAPMRQLGFDTKESIALFSSWEKAGVNTEIAFSGMKQAIGKWAREGKDARVEFRKVLGDIKSAPTLAEATTKALEVFGQKAGPDLADAIKGGRFEFEEMLQALEKGTGTLESTFENTQDPMDKFRQTMNQLKVVGAELGETILRFLKPVLEKISEKVRTLSNWFNGLSDAKKDLIVKIGLFVASLSLVLITLGKVVGVVGRTIKNFHDFKESFSTIKKGISDFKGSFESLKKGFASLKLMLATNPFGVILVAVGLLIAGLVLLYTKCEWFRNAVNKFFKVVGQYFSEFYNSKIKPIVDKIIELFKSLSNFFVENAETFKQIFQSIWDYLVNSWNLFWSIFEPVFTAAWEFIKTYFSNLWETIKGIWDIFAGLFSGDWERVWNGITTFVSGIWENLKLIFSTALDILWTLIKTIFTAIWETIKSIFNNIPSFISGIWNGAKNIFSTLLSSIWDIVKSSVSGIFNSVSEWFSKIPVKIKEIWNDALSYLKSINLIQVGKDIIWGLINGIGSMGDALWQAAKNIGRRFVSSIKSFFGINSPSRLMKGFGVNIGEGLEIGVKDKESDVENSGKNLAKVFTKGYKNHQEHLKSSLSGNYNLTTTSRLGSNINNIVSELNKLKGSFAVTVPVYLNGREIARATNADIDNLQGYKIKRERSI